MTAELRDLQKKPLPPDSWERVQELITQRGVIEMRNIFETAKSEDWHFGIGVDILDILLAQRDLGKIDFLQSPSQKTPRKIYIISRYLLTKQTEGVDQTNHSKNHQLDPALTKFVQGLVPFFPQNC